MRTRSTLLLGLICVTGCQKDRTATPDQPTPRPDAPMDQPADRPELPPTAEPGQDGVFQGVGSVLVQVRGTHAFGSAPRVEVELFDDDGAIRTLAGDVEPFFRPDAPGAPHAAATLAEGEWLVQRWWPSELAPTRAAVTLFDGATRLDTFEHPVTAVAVAAGDFEQSCDPAGFANRCADGSACFVYPRPVAGFCVPTTVAAWRTDAGVTLDVRTGPDNDGGLTGIDVARGERVEHVPLETNWSARQRYLARVDAPVDDVVDAYLNAHRFRAPIRAPIVLEDGEDCDLQRVADTCAGDAICTVDAICDVVHPPTITRAYYNGSRIWEGVHLTGNDPNGDVAGIELTRHRPDDSSATEWYPVSGWREPGRRAPSWHLGVQADDDGQFELLWANETRNGLLGLDEVEVVVIDRQGQRSAPTATVVGVPEGRDGYLADGALCDVMQAGYWGHCAEGSVCDVLDGTRAHVCQRPQTCSVPDRFAVLEGDRAVGNTAQSDDLTRLSCSSPSYAGEAGFILEADVEGTYRVRVTSERAHLAGLGVRMACDLPNSLRACIGATEDQGADALTTEVWLDVGEAAYIVVESGLWGGPFELSIERP